MVDYVTNVTQQLLMEKKLVAVTAFEKESASTAPNNN